MITTRLTYLATFTLPLLALAIAVFYFERHLGYPPCPLCMGQRAIFWLIALSSVPMFLLSANSKSSMHTWVPGIPVVFSTLGMYVAGRHIYLQNTPPNPFESCLPSVEYIIEALPFSDVIHALFVGAGKCGDIHWSFLGMSIPGLSFVAFLVLFIASAWAWRQLLVARKEKTPRG